MVDYFYFHSLLVLFVDFRGKSPRKIRSTREKLAKVKSPIVLIPSINIKTNQIMTFLQFISHTHNESQPLPKGKVQNSVFHFFLVIKWKNFDFREMEDNKNKWKISKLTTQWSTFAFAFLHTLLVRKGRPKKFCAIKYSTWRCFGIKINLFYYSKHIAVHIGKTSVDVVSTMMMMSFLISHYLLRLLLSLANVPRWYFVVVRLSSASHAPSSSQYSPFVSLGKPQFTFSRSQQDIEHQNCAGGEEVVTVAKQKECLVLKYAQFAALALTALNFVCHWTTERTRLIFFHISINFYDA